MTPDAFDDLIGALAGIPRLPGAACRDEDPRLFDGDDPGLTDVALKICATCRCRRACADWADTMSNRELGGIVGGILRPWDAQRTSKRAS